MISPVQAIRKYCISCGSGSLKSVKICDDRDCALYSFRMGVNPNRQGIGGKPPSTKKKGVSS